MLSRFLSLSFILGTALTGALPQAAHATPELERMNQRMIQVYDATPNRRSRDGSDSAPREIRNGFSNLSANGIPLFKNMPELSSASDLRELVLQEYLRSQPSWGMPWLPLSWTLELTHTEVEYAPVLSNLVGRMAAMGTPLNDDELLVAYLAMGSVYHTDNAGDMINTMRVRADELGERDKADFWDIRVEIHQEPSLATVGRVEQYIANLPSNSVNRRAMANEILGYLNLLFGNADVDTYLNAHTLDALWRDPLAASRGIMSAVINASDEASTRQALDYALTNLDTMANAGLGVAGNMRTLQSGNMAYQWFDLAKQYHRQVFAIGNALNGRLQSFGVSMSMNEIVKLVSIYVRSNVSVGIMSSNAMDVVSRVERAIAAKKGAALTVVEVRNLLSELEGMVPVAARRVKGIFGSPLQKYLWYVAQAERFVDDTIRSSALLPLSNLIAAAQGSLQTIEGAGLTIGTAKINSPFRVLNPGIAKGELVIVSEQDLANEEYSWNPEKIYLLTKTPAWLQKVAGILTCDSGSVISHVQLLASNHGLPNVNISCNLEPHLRKMEGQEVLLIGLPNGEAAVKLVSKASAQEMAVYNEYNKVQEATRVRLRRPERLDINYPLRLEQLRLKHSGRVAGGKACGQGELASVFPDMVPRGVVLPFGVYYEHMKDTGIYDDVQKTFSDPALRGSSPEVVARRKSALARIRERIKGIQFKPAVEDYLIRVLSSDPFRGRGVFVRSDTNAEDLPGFVGAGLNETQPNVYGIDNILAAVRYVWASPFTEKAFTWREDLIENPWDIFPSVIIQLAVNSDKAGVMIVGHHTEDDVTDAVIIAANEGLGITTVNGDYVAEETEVYRSNGEIRRIRKAYAPTRKRLVVGGGFSEVPVVGYDPIVTDFEAQRMASIGDKIQKHVARRYGNLAKWDMEWGIVGDRQILFQMRVFNGNKIAKNVSMLRTLQTGGANATKVKIPSDDRMFVMGTH